MVWALVKLRRKRNQYFSYLPVSSPLRRCGHVYLLPRDLVDSFLQLEKYCHALEVEYGDVVMQLYDVEAGILKELLLRSAVIGRVLHTKTSVQLIAPLSLSTKPEVEVYAVPPEDLDTFIRDLARRYMCYLAFQLLRRSKSLHYLLQSLTKMRETLEKCGIKVRLGQPNLKLD